MDMHNKPIQQRIDWLIDHADNYSSAYSSPEEYLARERYRAVHPTEIVVLKCMDGRINIPVATNTPPGIIMPIRNLGGIFNLGWPHLGEVLADHVKSTATAGRRVLMLVTYHYSKGDPHRGCAGFSYDSAAAIAQTYTIKEQVELIFGTGHGTVYPIVCGFETDEDALILHGTNGEILDISTFAAEDVNTLGLRLNALYPDMPNQVRQDLLHLVLGNIDHIAEVKRAVRTLDVEHREWMICLGRGFDFLHMPNLAMIIGPYSPDLADPIRQAAGIIESNMRAGRIPDDGFLLLALAPYAEIGIDRARAELKSQFLSQFASGVIRTEHPWLAGKMFMKTAVINWRSRAMEIII